MPDESQNQNDTGATNDESQVDGSQGDNQGVDHEANRKAQVERLRKEREDAKAEAAVWKERAEKAIKAKEASGDDDDTEDDELLIEKQEFYREVAINEVTRKLDMEGVPKSIKDRILENPFNPAWCDKKALEYELIGIDDKDYKGQFEASKKVALMSIPKFLEEFKTKGEEKKGEDKKGVGNNPPVGEKAAAEKDLWQMSEEELQALKKSL